MTKEDLKQYRAIVQRIDDLEEESVRLRARIESAAGSVIVPGGGSPESDWMSAMIAKLIDLRERIVRTYDALVARRQEIDAAIAGLDPREALLIHKRYVQGLKWEQIAIDMGYSWRQVHNIHSEALKKIAHYCT